MKRSWVWPVWVVVSLLALSRPVWLCAEPETIDLKALAKQARPAVMLLVVSDASGKDFGTGTGFLVSADGKLITNHHVIDGAATIVAKAENGGLYPIEVVLESDPENDIAVLKISGRGCRFWSWQIATTWRLGRASRLSVARWG